MPLAGGGRELHQQQQSISSPAKSRMDPAEAQLLGNYSGNNQGNESSDNFPPLRDLVQN
jgi:hypothetical protein